MMSRGLVACWILAACELVPTSLPAVAAELGTSPPIILISVDTLRADRLSCYGYRQQQTPNVDALTASGTLFSAVNAQAPLTLPSHVSLLTSTYPFSSGSEDNGQQLRRNSVTLARVLKLRGYETAAFLGGFVLDRRFGLDQGFDFYDSPFDLHGQNGTDPGDIKRLGGEVAQAAARWLAERSERQVFVFLHLYDLHTPYNLPTAFRARLGGPGYEAELSYVDEVLGDFWKFLRQRGLWEKSLIVFLSDHGESLGEHDESTHGYFIYQSTLWVPLIIHWPAGSGSFPSRVDKPASLLDVAPMILQFIGVAQPGEFQGRSLLGLLNRGARRTAEEVYSESLYAHNHFSCAPLRSLRTDRYKYIEAPKPELYDLARDPGELHNLYSSRKSLALALKERLQSLRSRFRNEHPAQPLALSPETVARLSSLGYIAVTRPNSESSESGLDPKDRIVEYEKYGRAIALASSGHLVESNALLNRLLAKDPLLLDVRISLGLNQQRLGEHRDAIENFRKVLKRDPLNVLAHFDLAVSDYALKRMDDAAKELDVTLMIAPSYSHAEELLGIILMQKKEYKLARARFNHLLTIAPDDFAAHYNLGVLAIIEEQWNDGLQHLRWALQVDPADAEAHNALGSLYFRQGDLGSARQEFSEAIRLQPRFASAHYNLGLVYRRQKKDAEASREFRKALEADPQFSAARDALDRLDQ